MADWDDKAIKGSDLEAVLAGVESDIKAGRDSATTDAEVVAASLNDLNARMESVEASQGEKNLGERIADALDSQNLFERGIRVKVRQTAKSLNGATNKTVTNISQNENGEITVTFSAISLSDYEKTANKKTSVTGNESSNTYYPTIKALVDYLDSRLQNLGGKKITNNGQPFTNSSQLPSSTPYYGQNINSDDYAYVQDTGLASRYTATVTGSSVAWSLDYEIALPVFTTEQQAAIDSGITSTKVSGYDANVTDTEAHMADTDIHVTTTERSTWNGKQDAIADLDTIRSGAASGATAVQHDELAPYMQDSVEGNTVAAALNEQDARLKALENADQNKLGNAVADSLDSQVLKVGGVDVSPNDHTHQVKINGVTKTIAKTGDTPVDLGTYLTQHQDISGKADVSSVVDSASYDSSNHTIIFKHGSTQLFTLDAAAFVKDGMVNSVAISNGYLVITFNTDAGKQPISIPLTDIFNPNNYYTKTQTDLLLSGKQDSLPYANSKYGIDISGSSSSASSAGELEKVSLGQVDVLPVSLIVNSNFKAGTFLLKGDDYGGQPYVFGNVTIPNNQWYRFTVSGQTSTDCVITLEPCTGGSSSPFNIFKILVDNGSSRTDKVMKVVRVPYESTTSAVGDSSKPIYVDESGEIKECNPSSMSVGYASAAESGSALAQAIAPDADVALIVYGDATYSSVKALYNAGKKLYLVTGGNIQPSGRFEYRIPLTLITYDANLEVNAFYFEQTQDDRAGASEVGSIAVYRLDSTGWTTTPKQVGYATNAGHAANADTATNATNDHGGAKIRDAYISNVVDSVNDVTNPPQYIYSFDGVSVAANQDGFRIATLSRYKIPFPRVYFHTRSELTVRNPTDPSSTTPDNCAYIINNSLASLGYNGFTCLGHEKPIGFGQKYYGVCSTDLIGGLTEIDFDFSATWVNHIMEQQNFPPSFMQIVFAATWDENDFQQYPNCGYGFALNHENIFTTTRGSYRYEQGVSGFNNDMPVMGHVRMVGFIGNAGLRRLFIGAFQPRSDAYIKMKISNVRVRGNLGAIEASAT